MAILPHEQRRQADRVVPGWCELGRPNDVQDGRRDAQVNRMRCAPAQAPEQDADAGNQNRLTT